MAEGIVIEGVALFKAAMSRWTGEMDVATRLGVADGLAVIVRQAQLNSSGRPGPNVVTGSHRRSFRIEGPTRLGAHVWVGTAGPTMVYSRRLELGGGNWPEGLRFPYFEPAVQLMGRTQIPAIFRRRWAGARPR